MVSIEPTAPLYSSPHGARIEPECDRARRKTFCKVDASEAAIGIGDLLTASSTPGHAMKATDPLRAFGAVIGKALRPLRAGTGLIPILVTLQ